MILCGVGNGVSFTGIEFQEISAAIRFLILDVVSVFGKMERKPVGVAVIGQYNKKNVF